MGLLAEHIVKKFGVRSSTVFNPVTGTCAATATLIARSNPDRLALIVVNLGANSMYVCWDADVSATRGILLAANGGTLALLADEDLELTGYELYGIAPAGAVSIFIVEVEGIRS